MSRTAKRLTILELMKAVGNRADEMADDRLRQYCLQILNSLRSGKPEIEVRAVGQGSSYQSAEILHLPHRESEHAQQAYDSAAWGAVFGGIGWTVKNPKVGII